jgi:hypothetical protein
MFSKFGAILYLIEKHTDNSVARRACKNSRQGPVSIASGPRRHGSQPHSGRIRAPRQRGTDDGRMDAMWPHKKLKKPKYKTHRYKIVPNFHVEHSDNFTQSVGIRI